MRGLGQRGGGQIPLFQGKGQPTLFRASAHAMRAFCAICGTQLTFSGDASPSEVDVTLCCLDLSSGVAPQDHPFTNSQLPWPKLSDGLPRYQQSRSDG